MTRRAAVLVIVALATGCPGRTAPSPPAAVRAGAPDAAPVATGTALAGFFDVKVGQVYLYDLLAGGEREDTVTARDAATLTLSRKSRFGDQEGRPMTVAIPLRAPGAPPDFEPPAGAKVATVGDESLVILGVYVRVRGPRDDVPRQHAPRVARRLLSLRPQDRRERVRDGPPPGDSRSCRPGEVT